MNKIVKKQSISEIISIRLSNEIHQIVFWIFGLGEVVMYDCGQPALQFAFATISYLWILANFFIDEQKGIIYFLTFNLLTLGIFNFWGQSGIISYWGLRIGGVSFNIVFTAFLTLWMIIRKKGKRLFPTDKYSIFFFVFYAYTLIIGISTSLLGDTFGDNLLNDFLTFTPILFYAILIKDLNRTKLLYIILKTFTITIIALILAYILNKRFEYSQEMFIVGNTMSFLSPIGVIVLWKYYSKKNMCFYLVAMTFLIVMESYFAGGKTIIMFALIILWELTKSKKILFAGTIIIFIVFQILISYLNEIASQMDNKILAFKITQITQIAGDIDLMTIAMDYSSMGNILAECITLIKYYIENPHMLLWGQGMGAGIPDYYGFLEPFAGRAGYNAIDAVRNNYYNLHIAPYKVLANAGIIIFIWYIKILWNLFRTHDAIAFMAFLMLSLMFYVSKEFFLITYILMLIVEKKHQTPIYKCHENFSC